MKKTWMNALEVIFADSLSQTYRLLFETCVRIGYFIHSGYVFLQNCLRVSWYPKISNFGYPVTEITENAQPYNMDQGLDALLTLEWMHFCYFLVDDTMKRAGNPQVDFYTSLLILTIVWMHLQTFNGCCVLLN